MGVEVANAHAANTTQPINVRIYTNTGGAFPAGTRTLISSLATTVADGNLYFQDIAIAPPAQPATTEIVVEINSPTGSAGAQNYFRIGSNSAAQTAPSYRSSTTGGCGSSTPTDMATTGAPFTKLLIGLVGLGPTAAEASVSGRVVTANGNGIRNARVSITLPNGEFRTVLSGTFGYYHIEDLEVGQTYILSIASKRFTFANSNMAINLNGNLTNVDFVAEE